MPWLQDAEIFEEKADALMDFLEFLLTALLADQLASQEEEAEARNRLESELEELRSEVESLKSDP